MRKNIKSWIEVTLGKIINQSSGNLVIVRRDGTVANYSTMVSLSVIKPVPASTPLRREEFAALKNAPRRYLETRGKR